MAWAQSPGGDTATQTTPASPPAPASAGDTLDPSAPMATMPDLGIDWPDLPDTSSGDTEQGVAAQGKKERYDIVLNGLGSVDEDLMRQRFDGVSALVKGRHNEANAAQIDLRARQDAAALTDILRAEGYYDAEVTPRVQRAGATGRMRVVLTAVPGDRYRFSDVVLNGLPEDPALLAAFPVKKGDVVDADKVIAAEASFKTALGKQGYAFAKAKQPEITVDHATRTATLIMAVETEGTKARFGHISVTGQKLFSARHVQRIARFRPGDRYDATLLDDLRRALIQTSLVSVVKITTVRGAQPGTVDVVVNLEKAPPRTIALQIGYGTGQGIRGQLSWQHRNFFAPEGAVTLSGELGTRQQSAGLSFRRSNFLQRDQALTAQVTASHSNLEAYDAKTIVVGVGIERQSNIIWQKKWTWSVGPQFILSNERNIEPSTTVFERRTFHIIALPATLGYDGSDDLLNPTRGFRLSGLISPEESFQNGSVTYVRTQFDASAYLPVNNAKVVLAGRVRFGSIIGAALDDIAPSRRFYSGGGGSVRGYGYQDLGPRDAKNRPIGGRGLAEFALEARVRLGKFAVVPFFDGGSVSTQSLPKFDRFQFGTGLGVRYYTSFGPIRVDVGTPLNRQKGDNRLSIQVSLGQAF
jgi:translocation and assembly module TamA